MLAYVQRMSVLLGAFEQPARNDIVSIPCVAHTHHHRHIIHVDEWRRPQYWGANNYPLRGGKGTDFEGGVRTAAFVSGGFLPQSVRGTVSHEMIHVTDWCVKATRSSCVCADLWLVIVGV